MHFSKRHQIMMMSGQFHAPTALLPVPILCEAGWTLARSTLNARETVSALANIVTRFHQDYSYPRYPDLTEREPVFMVHRVRKRLYLFQKFFFGPPDVIESFIQYTKS
jgi:hypothetical protein